MSKKIRRNNVFGFPIHTRSNYNCDYFQDNRRDKKFDECLCPMAKIFMKDNHFVTIIKCEEEYQRCPIYLKQSPNDIDIISKYIQKYVDGGWLLISDKHWEVLKNDKMSVSNDMYLDLLFKYFGFHSEESDVVDGHLYNCLKIRIQE